MEILLTRINELEDQNNANKEALQQLLHEKRESQMESSFIAIKNTATVTGNRKLSEDDFDSGDSAWMLVSCALVLFMTIPGLALFYGGMAHTDNKLEVVLHCFVITALVTFLWLCFGYSLALAPVGNNGTAYSLFGNESRFWLSGLGLNTSHQNAPTIPESVYCVYQLTFAIITPALITGAFAERMKFRSMLVFITLWHFLVYCPIAHSLWHPSGFLYKYGALDYAGGCVVHISSGFAGLVIAWFLGRRPDQAPDLDRRHNRIFTLAGASMLWVGWFGFNAGSALGASNRAGMALLVTQIATGVAVLSWMTTEFIFSNNNQITVIGTASGALAGLVAVTPASGFIDPTGAFFIGLLAGPLCYGGCQLKFLMKIDDALDVFGIHGVAGMLGCIMTGFFATDSADTKANGVFYTDTFYGGRQLGIQLYAITISVFWSLTFTTLICCFLHYTIKLRDNRRTFARDVDGNFQPQFYVPEDNQLVGVPAPHPIPIANLGNANVEL
eukprot:gene7355-7936_t